jgi:branched-subunit amino acid transport protein
MSITWIAILLLAAGTIAIKAVGPVTLGGDALPPRLEGVVSRLAPSLLAALVVVDTFGTSERTLVIDETAVGLAAAAVALALRLPMFAVVVIAAVTTATVRAV